MQGLVFMSTAYCFMINLLRNDIVSVGDHFGLRIKIAEQLVSLVPRPLNDRMLLHHHYQAVGPIQLSLQTTPVHISVSKQNLKLRLRSLRSSGLTTPSSWLAKQQSREWLLSIETHSHALSTTLQTHWKWFQCKIVAGVVKFKSMNSTHRHPHHQELVSWSDGCLECRELISTTISIFSNLWQAMEWRRLARLWDLEAFWLWWLGIFSNSRDLH